MTAYKKFSRPSLRYVLSIVFCSVACSVFAFDKAPFPHRDSCGEQNKTGICKGTNLNDNDNEEQSKEFFKTVSHTFDRSKGETVQLSNRYGKVEVKTWAKSQVQVNVRITARANSERDAQISFDRINIAFSNGVDFIRAQTDIASMSSGSWWNVGGSSSSNSDFTIDYEVSMPANAPLNCVNRYGNTFIAALSSNVTAESHYGNFNLENADALTLVLAYGNGGVERANSVNVNCSYGNFRVENAKTVQLKTKYSNQNLQNIGTLDARTAYDEYKIGNVGTAKIDSRYGDFDIANVDELIVTSSYTDFKIKKLDKKGDFTSSYGDVHIDWLSRGFDLLNIKASYTDFVVKTDPVATYQIDASASYGDITRPNGSKGGKTTNGVTLVGSNSATKSMLRARMSYGDLIVR